MSSAPEFIQPTDITKMTDEEIDRLLDGIRERRLRSVQIYKQAEEDKKELEDQRAQDQLDKQLAMLKKELDRLDKTIDKVEDRANKIRALRLQLGIDT